jgi:hypothetical protein
MFPFHTASNSASMECFHDVIACSASQRAIGQPLYGLTAHRA